MHTRLNMSSSELLATPLTWGHIGKAFNYELHCTDHVWKERKGMGCVIYNQTARVDIASVLRMRCFNLVAHWNHLGHFLENADFQALRKTP